MVRIDGFVCWFDFCRAGGVVRPGAREGSGLTWLLELSREGMKDGEASASSYGKNSGFEASETLVTKAGLVVEYDDLVKVTKSVWATIMPLQKCVSNAICLANRRHDHGGAEGKSPAQCSVCQVPPLPNRTLSPIYSPFLPTEGRKL